MASTSPANVPLFTDICPNPPSWPCQTSGPTVRRCHRRHPLRGRPHGCCPWNREIPEENQNREIPEEKPESGDSGGDPADPARWAAVLLLACSIMSFRQTDVVTAGANSVVALAGACR